MNKKILKTKETRSNEAGFIMLTIPVILALFGFFITAMIHDTKPSQFYLETSTQQNMEDVRKALAAYVHRNYRLPCPGKPDASMADKGEQGKITDRICEETKGILPFRELGLPESAAKDEWGNYYTFKVSPDFTKTYSALDKDFVETGEGDEKMLISKSGTENGLHQLCRTASWIKKDQKEYMMSDGDMAKMDTTNVNYNIYKANFCCPSNVSAGSGGQFTAADNAGQAGQKTINLGNENKVFLAFEGLDKDIALWDEEKNRQNGRLHSKQMESWEKLLENASFVYNDSLKHHGEHVGDGLGLPHPYGRSHNDGKFHLAAAVFNIEHTSKEVDVNVRDFTMKLSDLGSNNWNAPVQISLDIVDSEGNSVETVSYVLQLPESPTGVGEISFSLDNIASNEGPKQAGFFNTESNYKVKREGEIDLDFIEAEKLYETSNNKLKKALDLEPEDDLIIDHLNGLEIGRIKVNASHSSIAFNEMSFGSPSVITNNDLIIRNEDDDVRITGRNEKDSYSPSDVIHTSTIDPDFESPAYAIISHGPNGEGAYLVNQTMAQVNNIPKAQENEDEWQNHSDDREVNDVRKITSTDSTETFDDIVMWDSQITLYNSLRNGTCESAQTL